MSKKLVGLVGAGAAATLLSFVPQFEGVILRGYRDPIGVVTACAGHTKTAVLGRAYTKEECNDLLIEDLIEHIEDIQPCIKVPLTSYQMAAFASFAYNVGATNFCSSTLLRKLNTEDYAGACAELSRWVYAGNQVLPGLVNRRKVERDICEGKME